jgi:hypothetical protein
LRSIEPRILIGRTAPVEGHPYDVVAQWIRQKHPELAPLFHLCKLPFRLGADSPYSLLVQWIQDPLHVTDPFNYLYALELQSDFDAAGFPVVNRVERQANTGKLEARKRLCEAGVCTPKIRSFATKTDFLDSVRSLPLPLIVREDVGHGCEFHLVQSVKDAEAVTWEKFYRPVVSEYVDVQSPDGRYRKYRCFVIGDSVITHHLQTSESWLTRGSNRIKDLQTREEEIAYLSSPDPNEDIMRATGKALELEYLGIDYSVDASGNVIVWEANQYPHLHFSKVDLIYRNFGMERTIAAMVRYYISAAGLEPSERLIRQASYDS